MLAIDQPREMTAAYLVIIDVVEEQSGRAKGIVGEQSILLRTASASPTWSVSPTLSDPHTRTPSARGGGIQVGSSP
jgi:hypothetical protein